MIFAVAALLLAVVLIVIYFVIKPDAKPEDKAPATTEEVRDEYGHLIRNNRPFIVDPVEVSDIKSIRVHNAADEYVLLNRGDSWAFEGAFEYELDLEMVSTLRANTRYLLAVEMVTDADLENMDKYGISKAEPEVWFEVKHKGGEYRVLVGDKTPDSNGFYVCLDGRDILYIVDTGIEESVLLTLNDYIKPVVADNISSADTMSLERLSIFHGGDAFLRIDAVKDRLTYGNNSTHRLTYPVSGHATSLTNFSTFLDAMAEITCEKTVLFGDFVTPEALAELGFITGADEHICDFTLIAEYPKQDIYLHFIEREDSYLIYSEGKNIVVSAPKTTFEFLDWELISWISSEVYLLDIYDVASIELITPKTQALFEVSGEDEIEVVCRGKSVSTPDFKSVYQTFMYVLVTDWGTPPENTDEIMGVIVTLESGEVLDYRFKAVSAVNSFYTLNGAGQFYVEREKLMEFRALFEALVPES